MLVDREAERRHSSFDLRAFWQKLSAHSGVSSPLGRDAGFGITLSKKRMHIRPVEPVFDGVKN